MSQQNATDLSATNDDLSSQLDDLTARADALESRIADLEDNHVQDCLSAIQSSGLYIGDRWRIYESSNNDLLVKDTVDSGQPSYRFTAGGSQTFS
jgi:hypothetical protein